MLTSLLPSLLANIQLQSPLIRPSLRVGGAAISWVRPELHMICKISQIFQFFMMTNFCCKMLGVVYSGNGTEQVAHSLGRVIDASPATDLPS